MCQRQLKTRLMKSEPAQSQHQRQSSTGVGMIPNLLGEYMSKSNSKLFIKLCKFFESSDLLKITSEARIVTYHIMAKAYSPKILNRSCNSKQMFCNTIQDSSYRYFLHELSKSAIGETGTTFDNSASISQMPNGKKLQSEMFDLQMGDA